MSTPSNIPPPGGDSPKGPTVFQGSPISTSTVWSNDPWVPTTTGIWVDLPGALIPANIGPGTPSYAGNFIVTFTAESLLKAKDDNGVVFLDVFFGGEPAHPLSDNHRFDSSIDMGTEWRSLTTVRVATIAPSFTQIKNVDAQVRLLYKTDSPQESGIQNWTLRVDRFN
ncbi:hypothetical protein ACFXAZ_30500 [Streptomyces sp. NPDC059477]|uniref:hypothetical protein n=1 Tax=Streptomyces sp. NPDC059477 TaxID=3346847 RepID=UPI0036A4F9FF